VVHPQHWPGHLEVAGKRVVVIGSGATAVSLVPALTEAAEHVVMLQRSPSYVVALPNEDPLSDRLHRLLPRRWVHRLLRWRSILQQQLIYRRSRTHPEEVRRLLLARVGRELDGKVAIEPHFTPTYDPWDQRLCVARDGDLFAALRSGKASVITDTIERFTPQGLQLGSGEILPTDIIVTATGLQPLVLGAVRLTVDGRAIDPADAVIYRGVMLSDVPNLILFWGYINASWTLRSELVAAFACRLIRHMGRKGRLQCTPRLRDGERTMERRPLMDGFTPGYVTRNAHLFPKQGDREPWINPQSYWRDRRSLLGRPLEDGVLEFS
jgi:cation diffusion facilitator CzcD-associated flavoprotein CzcO